MPSSATDPFAAVLGAGRGVRRTGFPSAPGDTFPTLEDFYAADDRRPNSPEADFGVRWRSAVHEGTFEVRYVGATGEVIAFEQAATSGWQVLVLGHVKPDHDPRKRHQGVYYKTLEEVLGGWVDDHQRENGIEQVTRRLAEHAADQAKPAGHQRA